MTDKQFHFEVLFKNQIYGLREAYQPPREWQADALDSYINSCGDWEQAHLNDGLFEQHRFIVYAGTGSGKTYCGANFASHLLNAEKIDKVVIVCPNRTILKQARATYMKKFNIELSKFHSKSHRQGIPSLIQGYVVTYHHLMEDPSIHRRICGPKTLVILDEIHHLADKNEWGISAVEAFGRARYIVGLTGSPYRSKREKIPFVTYVPTSDPDVVMFKADFSFTLGDAIEDSICRKPLFRFYPAKVRLRSSPDAIEEEYSFDDLVSEVIASNRLKTAVQYPSEGRTDLLHSALAECQIEQRKVMIFLGGDTDEERTPTEDATNILPDELVAHGVPLEAQETITGDTEDAQDKIEQFDQSDKRVMTSIFMVSEGVDVPNASAAIFLTSITAVPTTIQRIGRVLRKTDDGPAEALIFMFADRRLMAIADQIEQEIEAAASLRQKKEREKGVEVGSRHRAEGYCFEGGEPTVVKFDGRTHSHEVIEAERKWLAEQGLPTSLLSAVLSLRKKEKGDGND